MTTRECRQTVVIVGQDGQKQRVTISSEDLLTRDEIRDLIAQIITAHGSAETPIPILAVTPEKPSDPSIGSELHCFPSTPHKEDHHDS